MSSLSALGSNVTERRYYIIDVKDDGKHRYNKLDADGDGVDDGESLSGEEGKSENATGVGAAVQMALHKAATHANLAEEGNAALADRGIIVSKKGLRSIDGFTAANRNARAAFDFAGDPALPDRSAIDVSHVTPALSDFMSRTGGEDAALMWMALSTMARSAISEVKDAADLKNLMQKGKVEEKKNEIKSTEEQIQAEREAAAFQLMFAIASAMVQIMMSFSPMTAPIGQALAPVIKSLGDYLNKTSGPQREADDKKIETMRHQAMQEIFEQAAENAKSNYDDAREQVKLALKILTEHAERQTQISSTITRW